MTFQKRLMLEELSNFPDFQAGFLFLAFYCTGSNELIEIDSVQVLMIKDVYDLGDRNEVRCGGGGPAAVSGRPILSLAPGLVCPDAGGAWLRLALRCAAVAVLAAAVASAVASAVELAALHRRAALTVFAALLDRVPS